jgi:hypothetical protein
MMTKTNEGTCDSREGTKGNNGLPPIYSNQIDKARYQSIWF